jgi:hypothetical protein
MEENHEQILVLLPGPYDQVHLLKAIELIYWYRTYVLGLPTVFVILASRLEK